MNPSSLPDVQSERPDYPLYIDRVGIKNVKRRIIIEAPKGRLHFDAVIDVYVDLPASRRGIHMSRNIEAFIEAIDAARLMTLPTVEKILDTVCNILLRKHDYASRAEVIAKTTYFYEEDFLGHPTNEAADVEIKVAKTREGDVTYTVKVSLLGMTVCPCAQETYRSIEKTSSNPPPSHAQRAKLSIAVTTKGVFVRLERLIDAARKSFSSPTVSILKRYDEYRLVKYAFQHPRFVEDVARAALINLYKVLKGNVPEDSMVEVEVESYESIHPHNAYAHAKMTFGQLVSEIEEAPKEKT
ncbi:MAG: GTP cyclohydrolase I FolE2 [Thermoprotei archaeon]|nr:MAG: GTP cyclohydrolase I FolE2 [Thermoprotei archaeon]